jgi:electron transfer flavoprotein beta subunit
MSLNIVVCIKSVVIEAPKGKALRTPENSELNPFDRPALEAALQIREKFGGEVTAMTMGPPVGAEALAEAQAMGVDNAVLLSDPALAESDTVVTSRVLALAIRKTGPFDIVLFGTRTADSDTGQVGPQTATVLGLPFVSRIKNMHPAKDGWEITRTMDDWDETWMVQSPWAATIDVNAFTSRPVGLIGISEAYGAPSIQQMTLGDLDILPEAVGLTGSPTRVDSMEKIKRSRQCHTIDGEPREQANKLIEKLTHAGLIG